MASINKVILIGNVGNDPEVRQFDNGGQIATVSIATSERWNDRNTGEQREHTEWHRVVFNGRLAEIVAQYLSKGASVYIEGSIHTRKWTDNQGNDRYSTEIKAISMQMLGSRQQEQQSQQSYQQAPQGYQRSPQAQQYAAHKSGQPLPQSTLPSGGVADDYVPF